VRYVLPGYEGLSGIAVNLRRGNMDQHPGDMPNYPYPVYPATAVAGRTTGAGETE